MSTYEEDLMDQAAFDEMVQRYYNNKKLLKEQHQLIEDARQGIILLTEEIND